MGEGEVEGKLEARNSKFEAMFSRDAKALRSGAFPTTENFKLSLLNLNHRSAAADGSAAGHLDGGGAAGLADFGEALPVLSCHGLAGPALPHPQADEALAEQGRMRGDEDLAVQANDLGRGFDEGGCQATLGFELDPRLPLCGLLRDALEGLDRSRIQFTLQPGKQLVPHAVTGEGITRIGAIGQAGLVEFQQARHDGFAAGVKPGTPEHETLLEGADFGDPGQTSESGPAKEMVQNSFGVVIGCVAGDDRGGAAGLCHASEGGVAGFASLFLDRRAEWSLEWKVDPLDEAAHAPGCAL